MLSRQHGYAATLVLKTDLMEAPNTHES